MSTDISKDDLEKNSSSVILGMRPTFFRDQFENRMKKMWNNVNAMIAMIAMIAPCMLQYHPGQLIAVDMDEERNFRRPVCHKYLNGIRTTFSTSKLLQKQWRLLD